MENQEYFLKSPIFTIEHSKGQYSLNNKITSENEEEIYNQLQLMDFSSFSSLKYVNQSLKNNYNDQLVMLDKMITIIHDQLGENMKFQCIYLDVSCWEFANSQNLISFSNIVQRLLQINKNTFELYINIEYWKDVQPEGFEYLFYILKKTLKENQLTSFYLNMYGWRKSINESLIQLGETFEEMRSENLENFYLSISFWLNLDEEYFKYLCQGLKKALKNASKIKSYITDLDGLGFEDQSLKLYSEVLLELCQHSTLIVLDLDFGLWDITDESLLLLSEVLIKIIEKQPLWSLRLSLNNCEELTPFFCRNMYGLFKFLVNKVSLVYNYIELDNILVAVSEEQMLNSYLNILEMKKIHLEKLAVLTIPALNKINEMYRKEIIWEVAKRVTQCN